MRLKAAVITNAITDNSLEALHQEENIRVRKCIQLYLLLCQE